jgi:hypothetical protein
MATTPTTDVTPALKGSQCVIGRGKKYTDKRKAAGCNWQLPWNEKGQDSLYHFRTARRGLECWTGTEV